MCVFFILIAVNLQVIKNKILQFNNSNNILKILLLKITYVNRLGM